MGFLGEYAEWRDIRYLTTQYAVHKTFEGCEYLSYVGNVDKPQQPEGLKDYSNLFRCVSLTNLDLRDWDMSKVEKADNMFQDSRIMKLNLDECNFGNCLYMRDMFRNASITSISLDNCILNPEVNLTRCFKGLSTTLLDLTYVELMSSMKTDSLFVNADILLLLFGRGVELWLCNRAGIFDGFTPGSIPSWYRGGLV